MRRIFLAAPMLYDEDAAELNRKLQRRVMRRISRLGWLGSKSGQDDDSNSNSDLLALIRAASARGNAALSALRQPRASGGALSLRNSRAATTP